MSLFIKCIPYCIFPPIKLLKLLCVFASRKFGGYVFHLNFRIGSDVGRLVLFYLSFLWLKPQGTTKSWRNSSLTPPSLLSQPLIVLVFPSAVVREAVSTPWGNVKEQTGKEEFLPFSPPTVSTQWGLVAVLLLSDLQSPGYLRVY